MTHAEIKEDLSLFALGTLEADESREVQTHLDKGCDECEGEMRHWRDVVAMMALAHDDKIPPDLKLNLFERVEHESARRRPRWQSLLPLAAVLVLALVGVARETQLRSYIDKLRRHADELAVERDSSLRLAGDLRQDVTDSHRKIEELTTQLATKEKDIDELRSALAKAEETLAPLQAPGLRFVRLRQTPNNKPAEAHALLNTKDGRAVFYAFDLQPLAANKTYELWWITEKEGPVNAGLFHLDANGLGQVETATPPAAGAIKAAAVTIEPSGGVSKPTGPMVLLGNI